MRKTSKIIALILSMIFALQISPLQTLAQTLMYPQQQEQSEVIEPEFPSRDNTAERNPKILYEATEKRTEYEKHFKMDDGTYMVAKYQQPVHYLDKNQTWQDYDNSVQVDANTQMSAEDINLFKTDIDLNNSVDTTEYENRKSDKQIHLAKKAKEKKMISVNKDNYTISWGYSRTNKSTIEFINRNQQLEGNDAFLKLTKLQQEAWYKNVYTNVDLQYFIRPTGLKENIILNSKDAQKEFIMEYDIAKLNVFQIDDKTIELRNDKGDVIYTIKAPYMEDAKKQISNNVTLNILEQKNKKLTIKISIDEKWTNEETRAYPIKIDPEIIVGNNQAGIKTAYVSSAKPTLTNLGQPSQPYFAVGNNGTDKYRSFIDFTLPSLSPGDMVYEATFNFNEYGNTMASEAAGKLLINLQEVTSEWTTSGTSSVTWNTMPSFDSKVQDLTYTCYGSQVGRPLNTMNITNLVKKWYADSGTNFGIMLKAADESITSTMYSLFESEIYPDNTRPYLSIKYLNTIGIEPHYSYHNQSVGNTTAYTNDFTGNLTLVENIISMSGTRMPLNLQIIYNGCNNYVTNNGGINVGSGFTTNLNMTLQLLQGSSQMDRYVFADSDGTKHYYPLSVTENGNRTFKDEFNQNNKLIEFSDRYELFNDINKQTLIFRRNDGKLSSMKDSNGNILSLTYDANNRVTTITDGANRTATLSYTNGYLSSVVYGQGTISLTYDSVFPSKINTITYPGNLKTDYDYNSQGYISSVKSINKTGVVNGRIAYTYSVDGFFRITKVETSSDVDPATGKTTTIGQTMGITYYNDNRTMVITSGANDTYENGNGDDLKTFYVFDYVGRTSSVYNNYDYTSSYSYYDSNDARNNKMKSTSPTNKSNNNLLENNNFENTNAWLVTGISNPTVDVVTDQVFTGKKAARITRNGDFDVQNYQNITLSAGKTYTVSAYVNTQGISQATGGGAYVYFQNGGVVTKSNLITVSTFVPVVEGAPAVKPGENWKRITATVTVSATASYVVGIGSKSMSAPVYFDAIQLEEGDGASSYNYIQNGNMEMSDGATPERPKNWIASSTLTTNDYMKSGMTTDTNNKAMYITGEFGKLKNIRQTVYLNTSDMDTLLLSAKVKTTGVPNKSEVRASISAEVYYTGNSTPTKLPDMYFNPYTIARQTINTPLDLSNGVPVVGRTVEKIVLYLNFDNNANNVYFDDIALIQSSSPTYVYDADGNPTSVKASAEKKAQMEYNDKHLSKAIDANGYAYEYTYDINKNLKTAKTQTGVIYTYNYDQYGNAIGMDATPKTGAGKKLISTAIYSSTYNANYLTQIKDARGVYVNFTYDLNKDQLTQTSDATARVDNYTYTSTNKPNTISTTVQNGQNSQVTYNYDNNDNLQDITSNNQKYKFTYDSFGNVISTKVSGAIDLTLITNEYNANNGKLKKITYNNSKSYTPSYDSFGRLSSETYDGATSPKYSYTYNGAGELSKTIDNETGGNKSYNYDITGRLINTNETRAANLISGRYYYDLNNNVSKYLFDINGIRYSSSYVYGQDNLSSNSYLFNNSIVMAGYDELNRLTRKNVHTVPLTTSVKPKISYSTTYEDVDSNKTTILVSSYKTSLTGGTQEETNYQYQYDDYGNIVSITNVVTSDQIASYFYDGYNQLIRANEKDKGSYVFTYDINGNILTKTTYDFTLGTLGTARSVINYTYADTTWKDKLTNFNGTNITYDGIGNPLTMGTRSFTWQKGRQLATLTDTGLNSSYYYDNAGSRTRKTVNGVTTDYFYSNGKLMAQKTGNNTIVYQYDGNGDIIGFIYNGTCYFYVKNRQGDVIGIIDTTGTKVVNYSYDIWGKLLSIKDNAGNIITDSNNIGIINPIRYRGYYYDTETGFYYLQSRYYDANMSRFINSDCLIDPTDDKGFNLFAYCINDPINKSDPSGYKYFEWAFNPNENKPKSNPNYKTEVTTKIVDNGGNKGSAVITQTIFSLSNKDSLHIATGNAGDKDKEEESPMYVRAVTGISAGVITAVCSEAVITAVATKLALEQSTVTLISVAADGASGGIGALNLDFTSRKAMVERVIANKKDGDTELVVTDIVTIYESGHTLQNYFAETR